MQQSRRQFGKTIGMGALALSMGELIMGLSCGSVVSDILTAFNAVVSILGGAGIIPGPIVTVVSAALQDVVADVNAYDAAPAADKTSIGLKLALAIQLAQAQLQTFYSGLNLTGVLSVVIEGLIKIILSTLTGFLPALPIPPTSNPALRSAMALPRQITFVPQKRTSKQFRAACNKICTDNGYPKYF